METIITKVRPPRQRRDIVRRQRLVDLVAAQSDVKLILVSAPPGYGKTALVADCTAALQVQCAWYRLDPTDADPPVFLAHLLASIEQFYPSLGNRTRRALADGAASDVVVATLVNDLDELIAQRFWLILDDYHTIDQSLSVNRIVDSLLRYLPEACQVVIVTRTVPVRLSLSRLASEGLMAIVGQEELRFTAGEVKSLAHRLHGRFLSDAESIRLADESEGWAAALVLGSCLQLNEAAGYVRESGDRGRLFDVLAGEAFNNQPEPVQEFLLDSSLLETLSPSLCDRVLARRDSDAMLQWVDDHHLFVSSLSGDEPTYRYHQLFADFLAGRLAAEDPARLAAIHLRLASWYDDSGNPDLAIEHLLAAGQVDSAAELVVREVDRAHAGGRWLALIRWIESLPSEKRDVQPKLLRRLGNAYANTGRLNDSLAAFARAYACCHSTGNAEGMAEVLVGRAPVWRMLARLDEAIADCRAALSLTTETDGPTAALAHRSLGGALLLQGDSTSAARELETALSCFIRRGPPASAALAETDLSAALQQAGRADEAIAHARSAVRRWERLGNLGNLGLALNNLATAFHQKGHFGEARHWLSEAIDKSRVGGARQTEATALLSMGDVLADLGDFDTAIDHYDRGLDLGRAVGDPAIVCYALGAAADAHRLAGRFDDANVLLAEARHELALYPTAVASALVDYVTGAVALDQRELAAAASHLESAIAEYERIGDRRAALKALLHRSAVAQLMHGCDSPWTERAQLQVNAYPFPGALTPQLTRLSPIVEFGSAVRTGDGGTRLIEVRAFGAPEIAVGGKLIERRSWQAMTARDLFLFVLDRSEGVSRDELEVSFWPDADAGRAGAALRTTLHRLRRALGGRDVIESSFERYVVPRRHIESYDVTEFETLRSRAEETADGVKRSALLDRALALVRGPYLDGVRGEWCHSRRLELDAKVLSAILSLASTRAQLGDLAAAGSVYRRAVEWDPLAEDARSGLIRVLLDSGHPAEAIREYERYARMLEKEYGTLPGPEISALVRRARGA